MKNWLVNNIIDESRVERIMEQEFAHLLIHKFSVSKLRFIKERAYALKNQAIVIGAVTDESCKWLVYYKEMNIVIININHYSQAFSETIFLHLTFHLVYKEVKISKERIIENIKNHFEEKKIFGGVAVEVLKNFKYKKYFLSAF